MLTQGSFGQVSAEPESPHLHFALWAIVDRRDGPPGPNDIVPIDPTRPLYFEGKLVELPGIKKLERIAELD